MKNIGFFIIGSAIIFGAIILGCSTALSGTECYDKIQNYLVIGFIAHLLFIWGPLAAAAKKEKNTKKID